MLHDGLLLDLVEHGHCRGERKRLSAKRGREEDLLALGHDLLLPYQNIQRHSIGDRLPEGRQIRDHPVLPLYSPPVEPEARHDLVEHQPRTMLCREVAHFLKEPVSRRLETNGLHDHCRDLLAVFREHSLQ